MKAEKRALAFLNLSAVQRTLHHRASHVLYLDISLIPAACLRSEFVLSAAQRNGNEEKRRKREKEREREREKERKERINGGVENFILCRTKKREKLFLFVNAST